MPRTQDLNVRNIFRGTPLRIRDYVVEMKILFAPALHTAALITFPDFDLDCGGNYAVMIATWSKIGDGQRELIDDLKFELENLPSTRGLLPGIHESEEPVEDPDTVPDFFKDQDSFRIGPS